MRLNKIVFSVSMHTLRVDLILYIPCTNEYIIYKYLYTHIVSPYIHLFAYAQYIVHRCHTLRTFIYTTYVAYIKCDTYSRMVCVCITYQEAYMYNTKFVKPNITHTRRILTNHTTLYNRHTYTIYAFICAIPHFPFVGIW